MKSTKLNTAILLILLIGITNIINAQYHWCQIGADIDGEAAEDNSGYSVSISSNGQIVAIGAFGNDGNGSNSGHARVYNYSGGIWSQMGSDLDGEAVNDQSGWSVSLSSDGNTVAIGANGNDGSGSDAGHVRVYNYSGGVWFQMGTDIDGETDLDMSGWSVSLSSDGNKVAIGAWGNDGNGNKSGHVRIFNYNGSSWVQIGNDIDGEAAFDYSGHSVSFSSDGNRVAIGAYENDGSDVNAGHVRIYNYSGGNWIQMGNDIDGEAAEDNSGWSVSLSNDSNIVAIGAWRNNGNGDWMGHVRIYHYNGTVWNQQGADIDGEADYDQSGWSVSLSSDGNTLAIGAEGNDGNGSNSGHVRIYNYNGGNWTQIGSDIDGEATGDQSSCSVLSSDGNVVAIGAYRNNGNGNGAGHVRVYSFCGTKDSINVITCNSYISPSGNYTWTSSGIYLDTIQNVASCDSVITINLTINYSTSSTINPTVCDNYTSPSGNYTWTSSGVYNDTISNFVSCDSIITINLTINYSTSSTINPTVCDSYTSPSGNYTWTSSGVYNDTIPNFVSCDSIITINLTINYSTSSTINQTVCDNYTSPSGNYTWVSSGTYNDTILNFVGCDSVITINLIINNSTSSTIDTSVCDSYTSPSGNYIWTNFGTYNDTIQNFAGCDSVITINLTIKSTSSTINPTICNSYTSPSGNYTWTSSGAYVDTIQNFVGCDSVITINLTINPLPQIYAITGGGSYVIGDVGVPVGLSDSEIGVNYTLILNDSVTISDDMGTGNVIDFGNQTIAGIYTVTAENTTTNCVVEMYGSATVIVINSIENIRLKNEINIFPNPTTGNITVVGENIQEIELMNINGKTIRTITVKEEQLEIDLNKQVKGTYLLKIITNKGTTVEKIVVK